MLALLFGALAVQPACDLSLPSSDVCEAYCTNQCAFYNATTETGSPQNLTLYRITPANVTGVENKNTGDPIGDVNFFLERKNLTLECAANPSEWGCFLDGGEHGRVHRAEAPVPVPAWPSCMNIFAHLHILSASSAVYVRLACSQTTCLGSLLSRWTGSGAHTKSATRWSKALQDPSIHDPATSRDGTTRGTSSAARAA
jgi:hypothetical protein